IALFVHSEDVGKGRSIMFGGIDLGYIIEKRTQAFSADETDSDDYGIVFDFIAFHDLTPSTGTCFIPCMAHNESLNADITNDLWAVTLATIPR
ncbi:22080_t:CDS:2, partial [Gigaspora rosea]